MISNLFNSPQGYSVPLILGVLSYGITFLVLPLITGMITKGGFVRPNYRQEQIPVAVGLVFWCVTLIIGLVGYKMVLANNEILVFYLVFTAMTMLGLLDDLMGSREASGLKGHFIKLFKEKELTTGALKALAGGLIALAAGFYYGGWNADTHLESLRYASMLLVNALIIAFSTNVINLLDLRPGRAGKGFLFGALVIIVGSFIGRAPGIESLIILAIVTGCLLAYLPTDLKAKAMMGDTGSNPLGATLGILAVMSFGPTGKYVYLIFLLLFHVYTEKYSLTQTIEKSKILKYIDLLGRR